jgi:hypothetical protein
MNEQQPSDTNCSVCDESSTALPTLLFVLGRHRSRPDVGIVVLSVPGRAAGEVAIEARTVKGGDIAQ